MCKKTQRCTQEGGGGGRRGININLKKKLVNKNAIKVKTQNSYPLQNFPESLDPTPQNFC
jgi:hypothetical protein